MSALPILASEHITMAPFNPWKIDTERELVILRGKTSSSLRENWPSGPLDAPEKPNVDDTVPKLLSFGKPGILTVHW